MGGQEEGQRLGSGYLTDEEYDARSDAAAEAFKRGDYQDAFSRYQSLLVSMALRFLNEEGVQFAKPLVETTPTELLLGLASAASAELKERGDDPPFKVATAAWLLQAASELRLALEEPIPLQKTAVDRKVAEIVTRAQMVGQIDMLMTAARIGWIDKLMAFEMDRERRRAGAAQTHAKLAAVKERALGDALRITGTNPTLSNEDVAVKVRESLALSTTVRTLTEWVREWRRKGFLTEQKRTGR